MEKPAQLIPEKKKSLNQTESKGLSSEAHDDAPEEREEKVSASNGIDTIPDSGMQAWLQVLGAFFLWFNTWGLINAYGAFQSYYTVDLLRHMTPSAIAWIGSVQACLLLLVGALTGPVFDAGYFRTLLILGSSMVVFGLFMTSIATEYWQILLAQGFCVGIGTGCLFTPSVALLSTYFSSKLMIAMGLAASGSGIGGTLLPIVIHRLQPSIGFPWAIRTVGFISLGTLAVPNAVMRVRLLPPARRKLVDLSAWKGPAYCLYVLGFFVAFVGVFTPYFYIELYALERGLASAETAFYLLAVITGGSILGRLGPNLVAAKIGMYNVIIPCMILAGIFAFGFIGVPNPSSIIMVGVLYGFFSGAIVSISPTLAVQLSPNRAMIGTRMGMAFSAASAAMLIGPPVAGKLLDEHGFDAAFGFSGVCSIFGAVILCASRACHGGWRVMKKL
ncbi:hypothetical protein H2200_012167 [Cladophialophora chaetospira]|uniref:Major facilitator superfamily (MFS) profile domain-containing protein n=1 Tax=Cladophialophora chaetospira TaxID=386627 RepID=A0AA38WYB7_9EURO|nr:hypothetical protein H2200_012167 [Cladophialophora chaetospira]